MRWTQEIGQTAKYDAALSLTEFSLGKWTPK